MGKNFYTFVISNRFSMEKYIFMVLSIASAILAAVSCTNWDQQPSSKGSVTFIDDIEVVSLCGTWEEMGEQYGELAGSHIRHVQEYLQRVIGNDAAKRDSIMNIAEKLYSRYSHRLKQFFEGMERTSGLAMDQLIMNNAVEYAGGFFCSGLAAWGDYASGDLVYGRNYDALSYAPIADDIIITVYHPSDGSLSTATIGYAGEIYAVNAINEKGLFLELNNGMPTAGYDLDFERFSTTESLLEVMFDAYNLDYLDAFFKSYRSFGSFIIGVADENEARSYEICATGVENAAEANPKGLMAQTNYYVSPNWTYPTPSDEDSWMAITRRNNLLNLAESHKGHIDEKTMCGIMATHINDGGPMHYLTRYQLVFTPRTKKLLISIEKNSDWTEVNMNAFF